MTHFRKREIRGDDRGPSFVAIRDQIDEQPHRLQQRLRRIEVLIIDELGFVPYDRSSGRAQPLVLVNFHRAQMVSLR